MTDAVSDFLRMYSAAPVGQTPVQPNIAADEDKPEKEAIDRTIEMKEPEWEPVTVSEQPAKPDEFPVRFIDGSHSGQPVFSVRSPQGWPIAMMLSEVGAVSLMSKGRGFEREFIALDRVLSFVADPFPWQQVESFALDLLNRPELKLRLLPANRPREKHSPFDYEIMRQQARSRAVNEMATLERLALAVGSPRPTLVDGPLNRVMGAPDADGPLVVGVAKTQTADYLHDKGWQTLLGLRVSQRTPVFKYEGIRGDSGGLPVATWYLKLAGGPSIAPNWGFVRVEVPWNQFEFRGCDFGFVNRLSRWIVDARCRAESYARMPVSLEPIVRAEDALKPLFTPMSILVNRLYRQAGLFRRNEP